MLDYAKKEGREEGRKEGREEERLRAWAEKMVIARNLKIEGVDIKIIAEATGLSLEEVIDL
ncbi:MAG: hypothetical protein EOO88_00910 [Pedobacter sp.]|nr:MAG: hypothetical protein EOO88_00910 [Pedobacter sp.]